MINFITLKAGLLVLGHIVKMHYFFKNLLLYSGVCFRQTKCIVMMTMEESNFIVNSMTLG